MPLRCDVRDLASVLEKAGFENKDPVYDDDRNIVEEGHLGLKAESRCSERKHLAPYGLKEVELQHDGHRLDAAGGALHVPLMEYKRTNTVLSSLLSIDTPGEEV